MPLDVRKMPGLFWAYAELFEAIARYRPSIRTELERFAGMVERLEHEPLEPIVRQAIREIDGAFALAARLLEEASSASPESKVVKLSQAFRATQIQANYWHVMIDGVIFE